MVRGESIIIIKKVLSFRPIYNLFGIADGVTMERMQEANEHRFTLLGEELVEVSHEVSKFG